jgi:hypothetical protein
LIRHTSHAPSGRRIVDVTADLFLSGGVVDLARLRLLRLRLLPTAPAVDDHRLR